MHLLFSIAGNFLKAEDAKFLAEALHVNSSMTFLDLSSNKLTRFWNGSNWVTDMTGIKAIADALSVSSSMNSLK